MAMQDAFGPVFAYEWLRSSRRWQLYAVRAAFVGAILATLGCLWMSETRRESMALREVAAFGRAVYSTVVVVELSLLLLAAPAATAGSICLDRARGTLAHVMATDLTDAEIVLGKLAAGLIPVVGLVFCLFPVMMLVSLLGGADPATLLASLMVALGSAVATCTLAFALSVWGRKTQEVLSATYLVIFIWIAFLPMARSIALLFGSVRGSALDEVLTAVAWSTPFALVEPAYNQPPWEHLGRTSLFLGGCLAFSAVLAFATIRRIRRASLDDRVEAAPKPTWSTVRLPSILPSPSLDANPVLWREWSRARPSRWSRTTWRIYTAMALAGAVLGVFDATIRPGGSLEFAVSANMYMVVVGLLLLSVRAATSLSEERVRGSLDVLLTTPMTTPEILAGKWWGTFRLVPGLAFLPALIAGASCLNTGEWWNWAGFVAVILSWGAAITSAGLAFAVWVPRQGRALALSVGIYAAACVGWLVVALTLFGDANTMGAIVVMGSPLWGTVFGTLATANARIWSNETRGMLPAALACWSIFYFGVATALFAAACLTFDRCLGRVPGRSVHEPEKTRMLSLFPSFRREPARAAFEEARP